MHYFFLWLFLQHWENYEQLIVCSMRGWMTSFLTEMTVIHGYGSIQLKSEIVYGSLLSVIRVLISTSITSKASDIHCIHLFMYKICTDPKDTDETPTEWIDKGAARAQSCTKMSVSRTHNISMYNSFSRQHGFISIGLFVFNITSYW